MEKFAVMTPAQVAATRQAMKEMQEMYFNTKVGALKAIGEKLKKEAYTAAELSRMSGLSSGEIAAQFS